METEDSCDFPLMAPDCRKGEPVTCGPLVQTVSPCGNIPVGHSFMPQYSVVSFTSLSLPDLKPHKAVMLSNWQKDALEGKNYSVLCSYINTVNLPQLLACHIVSSPLSSPYTFTLVVTYVN
ncbi:hypothetical protein INR49_016463 [Caranx melampygus]|nr:hypothetical protein INR49_016463 [Caranx melampygus]